MTANTKHTPATPLKVAGEVQMKALSHEMTMLRRANERLTADRARLVAALRMARSMLEPDATGGQLAAAGNTIDALLAELGE